MEEDYALPTYSVNEVIAGFKAHPELLVRTEFITKEKEKTVLTREESEKRLKDAILVVEGASLIRNEYGHKLFADFFFFITQCAFTTLRVPSPHCVWVHLDLQWMAFSLGPPSPGPTGP